MKSASKKRTPSIVNLTVERRYLTEREVERLMDCARKCGRYGQSPIATVCGPRRSATAMAADRTVRGPPARSPCQEWDSQRTSNPR